MRLTILKRADIKQASYFIQEIINRTFYYSKKARKEEIKKFSPLTIQKKLKNRSNLFLIAKERDKIIGMLDGYYDAGLFWADWLAIDPSKRRLGIGLALINFLERKLRKEKIHKIWCDCRISNKESKALLRKLNFEKITTIKKHWYNQDFILWQKSL